MGWARAVAARGGAVLAAVAMGATAKFVALMSCFSMCPQDDGGQLLVDILVGAGWAAAALGILGAILPHRRWAARVLFAAAGASLPLMMLYVPVAAAVVFAAAGVALRGGRSQVDELLSQVPRTARDARGEATSVRVPREDLHPRVGSQAAGAAQAHDDEPS